MGTLQKPGQKARAPCQRACDGSRAKKQKQVRLQDGCAEQVTEDGGQEPGRQPQGQQLHLLRAPVARKGGQLLRQGSPKTQLCEDRLGAIDFEPPLREAPQKKNF